LGVTEWVVSIGAGVAVFGAIELEKWMLRRAERRGQR
jgi:hypothetical protein